MRGRDEKYLDEVTIQIPGSERRARDPNALTNELAEGRTSVNRALERERSTMEASGMEERIEREMTEVVGRL
jgi:hypothetical protein